MPSQPPGNSGSTLNIASAELLLCNTQGPMSVSLLSQWIDFSSVHSAVFDASSRGAISTPDRCGQLQRLLVRPSVGVFSLLFLPMDYIFRSSGGVQDITAPPNLFKYCLSKRLCSTHKHNITATLNTMAHRVIVVATLSLEAAML